MSTTTGMIRRRSDGLIWVSLAVYIEKDRPVEDLHAFARSVGMTRRQFREDEGILPCYVPRTIEAENAVIERLGSCTVAFKGTPARTALDGELLDLCARV